MGAAPRSVEYVHQPYIFRLAPRFVLVHELEPPGRLAVGAPDPKCRVHAVLLVRVRVRVEVRVKVRVRVRVRVRDRVRVRVGARVRVRVRVRARVRARARVRVRLGSPARRADWRGKGTAACPPG